MKITGESHQIARNGKKPEISHEITFNMQETGPDEDKVRRSNLKNTQTVLE